MVGPHDGCYCRELGFTRDQVKGAQSVKCKWYGGLVMWNHIYMSYGGLMVKGWTHWSLDTGQFGIPLGQFVM